MRATAAPLLLAGLIAVAGCASASPEEAPATPVVTVETDREPGREMPPEPGPGEYRVGRSATVDPPRAGTADAVVVLVPGGGWSSAEPAGLAPLAAGLAAEGLAVVTITYGTSGTGDSYPVPLQDVTCAVAFAATQVPDVPVVLVGHSAGAHLVALAALTRADLAAAADPCPHPAADADGVVGLAGPYDVTRTGGLARSLFGTTQEEDSVTWQEGNPHTWVAERPEVPFLLVHGDADRVVPPSFTTSFADALELGGHPVQVELLPQVDHGDVYQAPVVAPLIVEWVRDVVVGTP